MAKIPKSPNLYLFLGLLVALGASVFYWASPGPAKDAATFLADVSQVLLLIGLFAAFLQVKVAVDDIKLRSRREAGVLAIEQAQQFAKKFIPDFGALERGLLKTLGSAQFNSPTPENFFGECLTQEEEKVCTELYKKVWDDDALYSPLLSFANHLESMAMLFTKGLADNTIVFDSMAGTYITMIDRLYFFYCAIRKEDNHLYRSTLELYKLWKSTLTNQQLQDARDQLERKIQATPPAQVQPVIGSEL